MERISRSQIVSAVLKDPEPILSGLSGLSAELDQALSPIIRQTQELLVGFEGLSFDSLEANQRLADAIQFLLDRLGCRIRCPRPDCSEPSAIACRASGGSRNGLFVFRHVVNGHHTNHTGSTRLPRLDLVPAPPRMRRHLSERS